MNGQALLAAPTPGVQPGCALLARHRVGRAADGASHQDRVSHGGPLYRRLRRSSIPTPRAAQGFAGSCTCAAGAIPPTSPTAADGPAHGPRFDPAVGGG